MKTDVRRFVRGAPVRSAISRERLRCMLCGSEYRRITPSHLNRKHGIELTEYRDRFPDARLTSAEMRREMSSYISRFWESQGRHWTESQILRRIRSRREAGRRLDPKTVLAEERTLYRAAIRVLGSWDEALRRSGVDPRDVRLRRRRSTFEVLRSIRESARRGIRPPDALVQAASAVFGSWRRALRAAGLRPRRRAPVAWTRRRVVSRILRRARTGESVSASEVHDHDAALWRAARRLFQKPWGELVRELGVEYRGSRSWSREDVIRELRNLSARGHGLGQKAVRREFPSLASAALRHLGTWRAALEAASVVAKEVEARPALQRSRGVRC